MSCDPDLLSLPTAVHGTELEDDEGRRAIPPVRPAKPHGDGLTDGYDPYFWKMFFFKKNFWKMSADRRAIIRKGLAVLKTL